MGCTALHAYVRVQTYHHRVVVRPTHPVTGNDEISQSRLDNNAEVGPSGYNIWLFF
jgi:hypothetical protein